MNADWVDSFHCTHSLVTKSLHYLLSYQISDLTKSSCPSSNLRQAPHSISHILQQAKAAIITLHTYTYGLYSTKGFMIKHQPQDYNTLYINTYKHAFFSHCDSIQYSSLAAPPLIILLLLQILLLLIFTSSYSLSSLLPIPIITSSYSLSSLPPIPYLHFLLFLIFTSTYSYLHFLLFLIFTSSYSLSSLPPT